MQESKILEYLDIFVEAVISQQVNEMFRESAEDTLTRYVNIPTVERKRTALHMAAQNNRRVKSSQLLSSRLLDLKANYTLVDVDNQGLLHICASHGNVALLSYGYKKLGLPLDAVDVKGRTPLHLAALEGKEQSAGPLIAWAKNVDTKDVDGMTPLHLAALSQNFRIVKHLLIKGATRNVKDTRKKLPRDIAILRNDPDIKKLLDEPCFLAGLNPVRPPIKPIKNDYCQFIFYHFIMLARYGLVAVFILPDLYFPFGCVSLVLFAAVVITFEVVSNMDPGFHEKPTDVTVVDLYQKYYPDFVCAYCEVRRGHNDKHCQYCHRCVKRFDHHCPWIRNCVGGRNQKLFTLFLVFTELDFIYHSAIGVLDFIGLVPHDSPLYENFAQESNGIDRTIALAVSVLCFVCAVIVAPLFWVQVTNFFYKTTTHQRFARGNASRKEPFETSEVSDTQSMLLSQYQEPEFDFLESGVGHTSESILNRDFVTVFDNSGCCGLSKRRRLTVAEPSSKDEI